MLLSPAPAHVTCPRQPPAKTSAHCCPKHSPQHLQHQPEPKRSNKMSSSHFILYTFLFLTHLIKKRFSGTIRVYLSIFKYKSHLSPVPKQLKANMAISIEKCSEKCFLVGILQLQDKMAAQWSQHSVVPPLADHRRSTELTWRCRMCEYCAGFCRGERRAHQCETERDHWL